MLILDSCVFIAYFRIEEESHKKAKKIIKESEHIIINDYVLSEIYTVLMLRESYEIAQKALNWIISNPKITIERLTNNEIKEVVTFLNTKQTSLSFVDVSLIVMQKNKKKKLVSFDKEIVQN